jgi:hypothetical protein
MDDRSTWPFVTQQEDRGGIARTIRRAARHQRFGKSPLSPPNQRLQFDTAEPILGSGVRDRPNHPRQQAMGILSSWRCHHELGGRRGCLSPRAQAGRDLLRGRSVDPRPGFLRGAHRQSLDAKSFPCSTAPAKPRRSRRATGPTAPCVRLVLNQSNDGLWGVCGEGGRRFESCVLCRLGNEVTPRGLACQFSCNGSFASGFDASRPINHAMGWMGPLALLVLAGWNVWTEEAIARLLSM